MSNLEPCDSGNGNGNDSNNSNMANGEQQQSCPTGKDKSARSESGNGNGSGNGSGSSSNSRSVRASGNGSGSNSRCGSVIDDTNDHSSLRATRSRPLARLDRLLRRWLPGYNYLRGAFANSSGNTSSSGSPGSTRLESITPHRRSMALSRSRSGSGSGSVSGSVRAQRSATCVEPTLPVRKRKDGEVVLDTGIAKSEFCMKLEKLLRAKLIVKE